MADDADAPEAEPEPEPQEMMHGVAVSHSRDQLVLHPSRDEYLDVVAALVAEGYIMCIDVCGVDYLDSPHVLPDGVAAERYEVVTNLINHVAASRIRLRVQVPAEDPTCPSLFATYAGCEAMEREAYDMFGIVFDGHPDMSRILMPEDWDGHPLRKDYAVGAIPVQFKAAP